MLQLVRMSTAEILAELPSLSSAELAQVEAKLRELIESNRATAQTKSGTANPARIHSPRLAHREQSKDFVKQVVELSPDAKL
jgi:hypothetical protein